MLAQPLQILLVVLHCALKCALFAGFDFGVIEISTDSKSMFAAIKILPLVSRSKFPSAEYLVSLGLSIERELLINSARVDQERCLRLEAICLSGA